MRRTTLALTILSGIIIAAVVGCSGGGSGSATPTLPPPDSAQTGQPRPTPTAANPVAINAETIAAGRELFAGGGGCSSCHAIEGVSHGVLGPELNGIASLSQGRIQGYSVEQYLRESIVDSCAYTVEGTDCNLMLNVMNTIRLTDADVDALVAFLLQQR